MSQVHRSLRIKHWRRTSKVAGCSLLAVGLAVGSATPAFAAITSILELDGNVVEGSPASAAPDWASFFTAGTNATPPAPVASLPTDFTAAGFTRDMTPGSTADSTTYTQGSKDTLPISTGWNCVGSGNVTDKGDIQNSYSSAYIDPNTHHLILFFGMEKNAPNGDNNMGVWFLQNGVSCTNPKTNGAGVPFTGDHKDGDVLLVAAFLSGGSQPVINAYEWTGGANGSLNQTASATGGKCGTAGSENICAITNAASIDTPWLTQDKNQQSQANKTGTGTTLGSDQFYEGGADITQIFGETPCFASYLANTRSSQSLTATLYDYAAGSVPTCGSLSVHKYIDKDMSGTKNTGDTTSGTAVTNWAVTVTGPNGFSCSGTTDSSGALSTVDCSASTLAVDQARTTLTNLPAGSYTVTETQKTGFFNTDPGPGVNTGATVSKTVQLGVGGDIDVLLGNECYIAKTFQVTGVPSGTGSLSVDWSVTSGPDNGAHGTVALTTNGTTASGTLSNTLVQTDVISWDFYITSDPTHTISGATGESLTDGAATCAKTNTAAFAFTTLNGFKYKDVDSNGSYDAATDFPGAGFVFDLKSGSTVLQTATSAADGSYSFSNVAPGTYTVHERSVTGWVQTEPVSGTGTALDRTITVHLGDVSDTIDNFGNTPLSTIGASFTSQAVLPGTTTAATNAVITCKNAANTTLVTGTTSVTKTNLRIGTYTCTIVITDP